MFLHFIVSEMICTGQRLIRCGDKTVPVIDDVSHITAGGQVVLEQAVEVILRKINRKIAGNPLAFINDT